MKKYLLLWTIAIAAIILFLYHRILSAYLVSDEYAYWKFVRNLDFINSFRIFLPSELGGMGKEVYYRPIVAWTIWFDTVVLPMTPLYFRLTSLLFHLINAMLIGLIAFYSFKRFLPAFFASLFFSVFPLHSQAVIYSVGGRDNIIVTMFYLLSFLAAIRSVETKKRIWIFTACATFLLALMTHESAATLPLSIFLFFFIHQRLDLGKVYSRYRYFILSLFLVFVFYFIIRSIVLHTVNPYALVGYMNASFMINNAFKLYCAIFIFLLFLRFLAKSIFRIFVTKEHIFWFYTVLIGILFLPTFYIPTQERHLYLPSFAFVLALCGIVYSLDIRFSKVNPLVRNAFWVGVVGVSILSGVFLMQRNERWFQGATIAEKMSKQIAGVIKKNDKEKKFYFINFPDSIDGVYVYRARMREAIEFAIGNDITQEFIVTPLIFGITSEANIIDKNSLILKSKNGFMLFLPELSSDGKFVVKTSEFVVTQLDARTLHVDFLKEEFDIRKSNIFLFQNGNAVYKPYSNYEKTKD